MTLTVWALRTNVDVVRILLMLVALVEWRRKFIGFFFCYVFRCSFYVTIVFTILYLIALFFVKVSFATIAVPASQQRALTTASKLCLNPTNQSSLKKKGNTKGGE